MLLKIVLHVCEALARERILLVSESSLFRFRAAELIDKIIEN